MNAFMKVVMVVVFSLSSAVAFAEGDHAGVLVFTARSLPPITGQAHASRVFYVDGADEAVRRLHFRNPRNAEMAKAQAVAMLQTPNGKAAIEQITQVGEGIALAWQHGVEKLPAVMVGGSHVVYGVLDVETAVRLVEESKNHGR